MLPQEGEPLPVGKNWQGGRRIRRRGRLCSHGGAYDGAEQVPGMRWVQERLLDVTGGDYDPALRWRWETSRALTVHLFSVHRRKASLPRR
jgi:hypothetical protein